MDSETSVRFMDLPIEMIDKILSYLSFDQIAKLRCVNQTFNNIGSDKLNSGFSELEQYHTKCLKAVKSRLPRRESERKHHHLARHSDILMSVETRLSMLSMTYTKYIEARHCCFIPGKVLDEAFKVLRIVSRNANATSNITTLPRPHDFLQEYRDISSMAMEHFEDKILPSIREKMKHDNTRLFRFKNRTGRLPYVEPWKLIMPQKDRMAVFGIGSSHLLPAPSTIPNSENSGDFGPGKVAPSKLHTKGKCSCAHRAVRTVKQEVYLFALKLKCQKKQLNSYLKTLKHMKRELRETRNAMNVLSKEVNRLKNEQSPSIDSTTKDTTSKDNSLSAPQSSQLCIHKTKKNALLEKKGIKRKLDNLGESSNKKCCCNHLCNKCMV